MDESERAREKEREWEMRISACVACGGVLGWGFGGREGSQTEANCGKYHIRPRGKIKRELIRESEVHTYRYMDEIYKVFFRFRFSSPGKWLGSSCGGRSASSCCGRSDKQSHK